MIEISDGLKIFLLLKFLLSLVKSAERVAVYAQTSVEDHCQSDSRPVKVTLDHRQTFLTKINNASTLFQIHTIIDFTFLTE